MINAYLSRITADHWSVKNNLQKAAHKLAHTMDKIFIPAEEVENFKKYFHSRIEELNKEFSRCKPLDFHTQRSYQEKDSWWIYCDGVFEMDLIKIKGIPFGQAEIRFE